MKFPRWEHCNQNLRLVYWDHGYKGEPQNRGDSLFLWILNIKRNVPSLVLRNFLVYILFLSSLRLFSSSMFNLEFFNEFVKVFQFSNQFFSELLAYCPYIEKVGWRIKYVSFCPIELLIFRFQLVLPCFISVSVDDCYKNSGLPLSGPSRCL